MEKEEKKADPFDKIFMGDHEKYWFDKGKDSMLAELKRKAKFESTKIMKENKYRKLEGELFDYKGYLKSVEKAVKYWKNRAERFENKSLAVSKKIEETKLTKKQKEKINSIFTSGSREYDGKAV